ncbi:MAG TPA: Maf family protein [Candidatus Polarisedimenticolia bacterium]|nr:Maf family protein [Candidatus Polarisedimenticolia bacterium]
MQRRDLILASASPRRRELLERLGLDLSVRPTDVDETPRDGEAPEALARRLAHAKAEALPAPARPALVIAADTLVVVDDRILGKPRDDAEARAFVGLLAGRTHEVITAVAVRACPEESIEVGALRSRVTFAPLSPAAVAWYVGTGEGRDKAGAYALQGIGSLFIDRVDGSYTNVIGLPLDWLRPHLVRFGFLPGSAL